MRSQDYIRQAVNDLHQAIASRKLEVDDLRKTMDLLEREKEQIMNAKKAEEHERLVLAERTDSDQSRASNMNRARMLRTEESQVERDFSKEHRNLMDKIQFQQRSIDDLNGFVASLERMLF